MESIEKPKEVLSVIIDGADRAKFALSRFPTLTKRETGNAMKQKVNGVLFHGGAITGDFLSLFTSSENIPSGSNQTIDALCRSLFVLHQKRSAQGINVIPEDLYIQLDNTTKDNKNRFFMAFCVYLIHIGMFRRLTVNFLPIGHTHEDIDRRFSRVSVHLKQRTTATISDLHQALQNSQPIRTECFVSRVEGMNNFSMAIVQQRLVVPQVDHLLSFRKFCFERDVEMETVPQRYYSNCFAGHSMSEKRQSWKKLHRLSNFFGVFLKCPPNMNLAPAIETKAFTVQELDAFRKRLRLTEVRLANPENTIRIRSELDRMATQRYASPE